MLLYCIRLFFGISFIALLAAIVIMCQNPTRSERVSTLQNCIYLANIVLALPLIVLIAVLDFGKFGFWDRSFLYVLGGLYCLLEVLIFAKYH